MLSFPALLDRLDPVGLDEWIRPLEPVIAERIADGAHGNLREWQDAVAALPAVERQLPTIADGAVAASSIDIAPPVADELTENLLRLRPWRKGPFRIGKVVVDAEWRSNIKWDRLEPMISPLTDRRVLDVGCGNGYYALRMHLAGARAVVGIDPTLLYVFQFHALSTFFAEQPVIVLPLRLADLPQRSRIFDTVFSMGVLYHQRAPIDHLRQLRDTLRPGGELVLETLVLPGDQPLSRTPPERYARMRNIWHLPTVPELETWLDRAGFLQINTGAACLTTSDEQRSTVWMPFESLMEALDSQNPSLTVEGWPAPQRTITVARIPG